MTDTQLNAIAAACHEVNRAYCETLGDTSQPPWSEAPDWQRESAVSGVEHALKDPTPGRSHERWLAHKEAEGWVCGETKDPTKKTHPCMVPFDKLPAEQQRKDVLFVRTATEIARALGVA